MKKQEVFRKFNTYGIYAISVCSMHISRIAEELIIWNSDIFKLVNLKDKMLTGSSIMPQKKNPDPAELIRGRAGKNFGSEVARCYQPVQCLKKNSVQREPVVH